MSSNQYQAKLERAEAIIGYHPQKPERYYLWEALQVAGSGHTRISGRSAYDGNKRLAIVGDSAIALALARPWYEKDEILGDWDRKRQQLLSNNNLARVAHESGLADCMVVNPRNPVQASTKLAANLVETIVGAVWIDSDESIDAVRRVMEALRLVTLNTPRRGHWHVGDQASGRDIATALLRMFYSSCQRLQQAAPRTRDFRVELTRQLLEAGRT